MAFPQTPLRWTAELALGADLTAAPSTWTQWTDVTALVQAPNGIVIGRGRASEFSTASAATGTATMANTDGRWVERNPVGVWYGLIGFNTPLRYLIAPDVNTASDNFNRTTASGFGTAPVGGAWTVVGTAGDYATTGTVAEITHPSAAVRHYAVLPAVLTTFDVTVRIRTAALATGAALSAGVVFRYVDASNSLRYEVLFNTDQTITARAVLRSAGTDTPGASHLAAGLTHVANTFYRVRAQSYSADGRSFRLKIWADNATEPATWTAYSTVNVAAVAGKMGVTSQRETGNTNANALVDFDDYALVDGPVRRHTGYINTLPRRWADHSATVLYAPVVCSGLTKRLEQGDVLNSAIRRGVLTAGVTPRAYWPCEDKAGATQLASGLPGGLPMQISQPESLGSGRAAGSDPVITVSNNGRIRGSVQPYAGTDWTVMCLINVPSAPPTAQALLQWYTSGSFITWQLVLTPQAGVDLLTLQAYDAGVVERLADVGVNFQGEPYGQQLWVEVSAAQVGGDISWSYTVWGAAGKTGTKTGATAGTVTGVSFGSGSGADQLSGTILGHISVWDNATISLGSFGQTGWAGEKSTDRWTRLAAQEAAPLSLVGTPTYDFASMGAPTSSTLLTQLREIETAEQGILYDELDGTLALLPREFRTNRAVDLTLDLAARNIAVLEPDNDDQQVVNDVVSSQPTGTSYRYTDTTSTRSSAKGYYSKPAAANLFVPQDLRQDAEYRTALGTVDEDRYTTIEVSLTGNPSLIPAWLNCNIGSRIQLVNTATLFTPDPIDLILEGYRETIFGHDWRIVLYTSSAKPWNAWILETGTGNQSKLDSGTSTLAAGVNSSATSLTVSTSDPQDLWSTSGDFPFDIGIAGEQMTVSAISSILTDAFGRTSASGWGNADSGQTYTLNQGAAAYSVGTGTGKIGPATIATLYQASIANVGPDVDVTVLFLPTVVATGAQLEQRLRVRDNGSTYYETLVQYQTSGVIDLYLQRGVTVLSAIGGALAYGAGTTVAVRLSVVGSTIRHKIWDNSTPEPVGWRATVTDTTYAGAATDSLDLGADRITSNTQPGWAAGFDGLTVTNPQTFTVTRHVNGVTKAQTALDPRGVPTQVHLWNPSVAAL